MTQARFSATFGFSLDAIKHWDAGRRTPKHPLAPCSPWSTKIPLQCSPRSILLRLLPPSAHPNHRSPRQGW